MDHSHHTVLNIFDAIFGRNEENLIVYSDEKQLKKQHENAALDDEQYSQSSPTAGENQFE